MAAKPKTSSEEDDILHEAREVFDLMVEADDHNRAAAEEDIRFARLSEHWPEDIRKQRELEGRPCLSIPKLPAFIRQVVNDSRQNKPSIKVHPVDSNADPETAKIISGLIRNIEYASNADVAYDTAVESAVSGGFGYFRIGLDYAHDDTFDLDITIDRVLNPFSVYGDPNSTAADSSDWMRAFVVDRMSKEDFERQYNGAEPIDWDVAGYSELKDPWFDDKSVQIAEYWVRKEIDRPICLLSNGTIINKEELATTLNGIPYEAFLAVEGVTITQKRVAKSFEVCQYILTGAKLLATNKWPGRFIPVVPVYGDEVYSDGKRYFRSLIRDAKDAQRSFNYWRSSATELVALAPRVPFIGPKGAFKTDADKWATANSRNWAYMEYDGQVPPQRQPLDSGPAAASLQEALNAADDMKSIIGMYDASLGARSNEVSGKAILARQREGDVSTFHFTDNLARAIRHGGRILIDLIPKIYNKERIIRVLGEDGSEELVPLHQPVTVKDENGQPQMQPGPMGQQIPMTRIYDLAAGKYDLAVSTGPSYTTRREEAAGQMMELMRLHPQAATVMGDLVAKNLDWPGADEIAERLKKLLPPQLQGAPDPETQKMIEEGKARIGELSDENAKLKSDAEAAKADKAVDAGKLQIDEQKVEIERQKLAIAQFEAETERMQAIHQMSQPQVMPMRPNGPAPFPQ